MAFTLKEVVLWGRSYDEYVKMFTLTDDDFKSSILGCSDGPASFNAVLARKGGDVVSIDPIYQFTEDAIKNRISETYDQVIEQTINRDQKGSGGILHVSTSTSSVERRVLSSHNTATLAADLRQSIGLDKPNSLPKDLGGKRKKFDEASINKCQQVIGNYMEYKKCCNIDV